MRFGAVPKKRVGSGEVYTANNRNLYLPLPLLSSPVSPLFADAYFNAKFTWNIFTLARIPRRKGSCNTRTPNGNVCLLAVVRIFHVGEMAFISIRVVGHRVGKAAVVTSTLQSSGGNYESLLIRLICIKARLEWRNDQSSRRG